MSAILRFSKALKKHGLRMSGKKNTHLSGGLLKDFWIVLDLNIPATLLVPLQWDVKEVKETAKACAQGPGLLLSDVGAS